MQPAVMEGAPLPASFYRRDTVRVARDLLGKILSHRVGGEVLAGRIVETEAYLGTDDPCSHAYRGPTPRCSVMFGPPGQAYVYFIYGNHYCFNVVAHEDAGGAGAVLVRALEPLQGIEDMIRRRETSNLKNLTNGPGKLTEALGIIRKQNGSRLFEGNLLILQAPLPAVRIARSPRIGISRARARLFRFTLRGNPYVSFPHPW